MKVVIIEDESLAAERLKSILDEIAGKFDILATLASVESAVEWFKSHEHPDLIFSDIKLLDGLSFEIFKQVKIEKPVIFTTAYDQYAIKAFELNSVDYLLKPIQNEKLEASLNKLKSLQHASDASQAYGEIIQYLEGQKSRFKSRFMIRVGQRIVSVPVEKVAYFYSEAKLTYLVTEDNKKYPMDQTLEILDQQVDPEIFFRVNRQFIVRFSAIAEMHPYFKGRIKLKLEPNCDQEIVISSDKSPEFKKWIDQ